VSETWEYQCKRRHATHHQSLVRTLWFLGHRLHGTISKIPVVRIHPGGSQLCLKMGWSFTMPSYRFQQRQEDIFWDYLSTLSEFHAWQLETEVLTSLIESSAVSYLTMGSVITSWHHIILELADRQKRQRSKSRTFCRKLSMRWEQHGKISYTKHYGLTEQITKHLLECHHTNLSTSRHVTYLLSWNSKLIGP
jgi:hypothetical protein